MSDSVWPHRRQPTRLRHPWDSSGKNNGVGCHFLLQCMKVKSEREVTQSCLTLSDPMGYSLPGSAIHGIFQVRVLEGVPLPSPNRIIHIDNYLKINGLNTPTKRLRLTSLWKRACMQFNLPYHSAWPPPQLYVIILYC